MGQCSRTIYLAQVELDPLCKFAHGLCEGRRAGVEDELAAEQGGLELLFEPALYELDVCLVKHTRWMWRLLRGFSDYICVDPEEQQDRIRGLRQKSVLDMPAVLKVVGPVHAIVEVVTDQDHVGVGMPPGNVVAEAVVLRHLFELWTESEHLGPALPRSGSVRCRRADDPRCEVSSNGRG